MSIWLYLREQQINHINIYIISTLKNQNIKKKKTLKTYLPYEIRFVWLITSKPYSQDINTSSIHVIPTLHPVIFNNIFLSRSRKSIINLSIMRWKLLRPITLVTNHTSLEAFHLGLRCKNSGCELDFSIGHINKHQWTSSLKFSIT